MKMPDGLARCSNRFAIALAGACVELMICLLVHYKQIDKM